MPMTPGYYMPNNWSGAYSVAPAQPVMQQSYTQPQQNTQGIIWVDGEVGAKAYQMPQGWPVGTPIPLWDTNDPIIYLKSINQMGMPNPLQKIHYTMEEQRSQSMLPAGNQMSTGMSGSENFVTKDDLDKKFEELKELLKNKESNQNGSNNGQNRGVNR